jgi:hypothetical protein
LIVLAIGFLAAMLRLDRKAPAPLLPSDAFAVTTPAGLGLWLLVLVAVAYSPLQIFIPIFLQSLHGLDPDSAPATASPAPRSAGRWPRCWSPARSRSGATGFIALGPVVMLVSLVAAGMVAGHGALLLCAAITGIGAGIGVCWAFVSQRVMSGARKGEEATAAASVPTVQQMGFALGAALSGLAANGAGFTVDLAHQAMVHVAFVVPVCLAVSAALGIAVALRLTSLAPR